MGMRVKMALAIFGIVLVSTTAALAQSPKPGLVAFGTLEKWADRNYSPIPKTDDPTQLAFCGQCAADDNCGSGHKCCGPSTCRQCFQVVTCPKR